VRLKRARPNPCRGSDCRLFFKIRGQDEMESHELAARYLTRGAQITGVATMSLCLTWISVSLRFYVRIRLLKFLGREDWLTFAAMVGDQRTEPNAETGDVELIFGRSSSQHYARFFSGRQIMDSERT
jgi:hypothetical protein